MKESMEILVKMVTTVTRGDVQVSCHLGSKELASLYWKVVVYDEQRSLQVSAA